MLQGAGFVPGAFDAQGLLDRDLDQVTTASLSLFKALVPLTGNYDIADRELTTTVDVQKEHSPAGSSYYASTESDAEESNGMEIKRTSLRPSEAALLRDHHENTALTTMAMSSTTTQVSAMYESDQV